ncbi:MAG: hypothetical protein GQ581_03480 [Methyloprofundus sp.]|nr:hypothetical protein [Methyloprofundus sp.]
MPSNSTPNSARISNNRRQKQRWHFFSLFQKGSIFQWTLIIFFIVTIPLIGTLLYSVSSIQDYINKSQETLFQTLKVIENSQLLSNDLLLMDRSIRQYLAVDDIDYFHIYQNHHQHFVDIATQPQQHQLTPQLQHSLSTLSNNEAQVFYKILANQKSITEQLVADDIKEYTALRTEAEQFLEQSNAQMRVETASLSALAKTLKTQVKQAALFSVPIALILGLLLLYLINRPIKHIERAIRKLGHAQFNRPIYIEGPSDLRIIGQRLEWLRNELNLLENSKQFFIKSISHELKTPLATAIEGTGLLQDELVGQLNTEQHKIIELLQIANMRLNGLIENLLEFQKANSRSTSMHYSQFNLNQLIDQISNDYQLLLDSKQVTVTVNAVAIKITADRDKMRVIINNLFSNALKFSPTGAEINIKLQIVGHNLHMLFADQGVGISSEQAPHIFTEFYQQQAPDSWKIKGSGVGLNLVKTYVLAHQGQIKLLSANIRYSGANFLVILPLTPR